MALPALLEASFLGHPAAAWLFFLLLVAVLVAVDLGLLERQGQVPSLRRSLLMSAGYAGVALLFGAWIWRAQGAHDAFAFLNGYLVEKMLSVDNVFVMAMVFASLGIPHAYQHRVLLWGVLGAMLMRGLLIGVGTAAVTRFEWVMILFAGLLIFTGVRMWREEDSSPVGTNATAGTSVRAGASGQVLAFLRRHLRLWPHLEGGAFAVRRTDPASGRAVWWATPLLLALCLVEASDLLFAIDSVPAVFAITTDPFLVYTSNILALLGLRALYFVLADLVHRFHYLKAALSAVLVFIGARILLQESGVAVPEAATLGVTVALLATGVLASLWLGKLQRPAPSCATAQPRPPAHADRQAQAPALVRPARPS